MFGRELRLKNRQGSGTSGGTGGGLEVLARGFHQSQSGAQMRNNADLNAPNMAHQTAMMMMAAGGNGAHPMLGSPMINAASMLPDPTILANLMPQMFQNLNTMNPFANFGQYPSQNQANGGHRGGNGGGGGGPDRSRHDWRNNRNQYHDNKPYDRMNDRDRQNNQRDWGGNDRRRDRSRSRDRNWTRNRSRSRDRNRYRNRR